VKSGDPPLLPLPPPTPPTLPLDIPPLGIPPLGIPPLGIPPLGIPPLGIPPLGIPPLGISAVLLKAGATGASPSARLRSLYAVARSLPAARQSFCCSVLNSLASNAFTDAGQSSGNGCEINPSRTSFVGMPWPRMKSTNLSPLMSPFTTPESLRTS
jgi:hypothetical protein